MSNKMKAIVVSIYVSVLWSAVHALSSNLSQDEPEIPRIKPEYILADSQYDPGKHLRFPSNLSIVEGANDEDDQAYFVFLQKFPLQGTPFFHTEVLVCPREEFTSSDQIVLDDFIQNIIPSESESSSDSAPEKENVYFVPIDESWWTQRTSNCVELGYGGAFCKHKCCSVPHKSDQIHFPLNARRSVIENADTSRKSLYLYGHGPLSGNLAYQDICGQSSPKCWSNWSGLDYNVLTNNCNTFTSTILSCVYGLSEKKPDLGVSDLITVHCQCDHPSPSFTDLMDAPKLY